MNDPADYESDILEWSEQQASALRDLARNRSDLSNVIDWENIAEEIEDVGRSELISVRSFVRLILIHVLKAVSLPDAALLLHWRKEVVSFHRDMLDRLTPSMLPRIDINKLWREALRQAEADLAVHGQSLAAAIPAQCPLELAELVAPEFEFVQLVEALRIGASPSLHQ